MDARYGGRRNGGYTLRDEITGEEMLEVYCWCQKKIVLVPKRLVALGLTRSCLSRGCRR